MAFQRRFRIPLLVWFAEFSVILIARVPKTDSVVWRATLLTSNLSSCEPDSAPFPLAEGVGDLHSK